MSESELNPEHSEFQRVYGELHNSIDPGEARALEALGHLHRIEVDRFYERRKIEWRLAFTLWFALVAVGVLALDHLDRATSSASGWLVFGLVWVIPFAHYFFEREAIVEGAKKARDTGYAMSNLARSRLGLKLADPDPYRPFVAHYWLVVVTLVLAAIIDAVLVASAGLHF